jgi:Domain of unknown function (DU1801)
MKTEVKTKVTDASVSKFIESIPDDAQRNDCRLIVEMMRKASKAEPKMWGSSIIGFDSYHYIGKSGREGDWLLAGISPRKQALTLYMCGGWQWNSDLLKKLGKHSLGMGCLYIKRLEDVNAPLLRKLIGDSLKRARKQVQLDAKKRSDEKKTRK